jgi:uncharacterized membrane protein HdeD (DUF308 family)/tetratricopeptide (TPR) repeat protein
MRLPEQLMERLVFAPRWSLDYKSVLQPMKKPVAFMSYAHRDDRGGRLTALREELSEAVSMHYGQDFEIFQDRDISWGQNWKERIDDSLDEVTFLIAIITPRFFNREECRRELRRFLDRENRVNRNDLILPIYYVDTPLVNDESKRATDELAQIIVTRQYADWRDLRHEPFDDPEVSKRMDQLARQISEVLYSVEAVEQRHSQIDNLYERARSAHQQRQWQAVIEAFAEIYSKDPLYPDSEGLLMSAREALDRAQQVDATNRYREAVKWAWMDQHLDRREVERLAELIEDFKLTPSTAAQIEREVMGETKEAILERREQAVKENYRKAVEAAWTDHDLSNAEAAQLHALSTELDLSPNAAADIERKVMDDTVEAIIQRQTGEEERRQRHLKELYDRARRSHQNQEWEAVGDVFEQIYSEDPNYPDPEGLLASSSDALEREQRVATLYDRGQRHMKAEEWQQALECFEEIQRLVPGYRETGELLARVRQELTTPPKVGVPDLSGQTLSQARSSLASKGLKLSVYKEVPSDTIAEGEIIEQSPEPETEVLAGSSVSITVSSGPYEVTATAPPGDQTRGDTYRREREESLLPALTGSWWAMALRGLVIVIFGLVSGWDYWSHIPGTFRLYSALMVTADGIVATIDAKTRADRRGPLIIQSRISFLVGFLVGFVWLIREVLPDQYPFVSYLSDFFMDHSVAPSLLGAWAIIIGIIRIIAAIQLRWETTNLWLMAISGVSLTVFGILFLLQNPGHFPWNLLVPLALVSGTALIAVALRVRDR